MKKIIMLVLCFAMIVCATACGMQTEKKDEKETKVIEATTEGTVNKEQTSDFIQLSVSERWDSQFDEEFGKTLSQISYPVVELSEESATRYPELAKAVYEVNAEEKQKAYASHEENIDMMREMLETNPDAEFYLSYETEVEVRRADSSVLTLLYYNYTYAGGAHGNYGYYGRSFDVKTGKELALTDVVTDVNALPELIKEQLELHWSEVNFFDTDSVNDIVKDPESVPWSLDYNGLTLYYNPYHLTSYAEGVQNVTISYKDNPDLFKSEYVSHPSKYAFHMEHAVLLSEDVTGDGVFDKIEFSGYAEDYLDKIIITINGEEMVDTDVWGFEANPVFVRTENGCYLYAECPSDNGYADTYCYKLGEKAERIGMIDSGRKHFMLKDEEADTYWCYLEVITDPEFFRLEKRAGFLGSAWPYAIYHVGDTGIPETDDIKYVFDEDIVDKLTMLCDLEVEKYDVSTETAGEKTTLKKGEKVGYYATNGVNIEYLKLEDGTIVRVMLDDAEGYPKTINGVSIFEIFDNILLAG